MSKKILAILNGKEIITILIGNKKVVAVLRRKEIVNSLAKNVATLHENFIR